MSCDEIWEDATGKEWWLHEMTDTHLLNATRFLREGLRGAWHFQPMGEIAAEAHASMLADAEDLEDAMLAELERRGLRDQLRQEDEMERRATAHPRWQEKEPASGKDR